MYKEVIPLSYVWFPNSLKEIVKEKNIKEKKKEKKNREEVDKLFSYGFLNSFYLFIYLSLLYKN